MIFDKLENIYRYSEYFQIDFDLEKEFIKGRFEITGNDEIFGIGLEYDTKDSVENLWEAHRKYLDVHIIIEGEEIVEIAEITAMYESQPYQHDFQLFTGTAAHKIHLKPEFFLILFPNEVHKTGVTVNEKCYIRKNVIKIRL